MAKKTQKTKFTKPDYLNEQQFTCIELYLQTGNVTEAAKKAGYSEKSAQQQGWRLLNGPKAKRWLKEREDIIASEKIADTNEILEYLTRVVRGEEKDQFGLDVSISERTRAAIELNKRMFDKVDTSANVTIINNIPKSVKTVRNK